MRHFFAFSHKRYHTAPDLHYLCNVKKEEFNRVLRFCVVGFSNFVIISLTVWIMMHLLEKTVYVANVVAYTLAIASSFVWNKVWVFKASHGSVAREIALYLLAFACAYLLQFAFLCCMVELVGLNEYLAQFLGLFVFGATNFLMNKLLTFKKR